VTISQSCSRACDSRQSDTSGNLRTSAPAESSRSFQLVCSGTLLRCVLFVRSTACGGTRTRLDRPVRLAKRVRRGSFQLTNTCEALLFRFR
jgi:hypothetical protein